MTMPHLMNCDHSEEWCLDCVKKMHDEHEQQVSQLQSTIAELRSRIEWSLPEDEFQ